MEEYSVTEPKGQEAMEGIYALRYRILREPWNQPHGSEKDELEPNAIHAFIQDQNKKVIAAGRLQKNSDKEGQIRYMCVDATSQKLGLGNKILHYLEKKAKDEMLEYIILQARTEVSNFYLKNGYVVIGDGHTLFGSIKHLKMRKDL